MRPSCSTHFLNIAFSPQHLREATEAAIAKYDYDAALMLSQVSYVNMNDLKDGAADRMSHSEHFGQEVLDETSGVHIPIEIYEGCESAFIARSCIFFFSPSSGDTRLLFLLTIILFLLLLHMQGFPLFHAKRSFPYVWH